MKGKKAMIRKSAFHTPSLYLGQFPPMFFGIAHNQITQKVVFKALMTQVTTKAPGPDKTNFGVLQLIWDWDKVQITNMVHHSIRLGYHRKEWKKAQGIFFEKGGKRDFGLVRSYRVISLLIYMGKVVEKVVARQLSEYCENNSKLHPGQMSGRKERSAINAVVALVHTVYER